MSNIQLAFIDDNLSEDIIDACLEVVHTQGYHNLAVMPNYLSMITKKSPTSKINLMIDFPWPVQEIGLLQYGIKHYTKLYPQIQSVIFGGYLLSYINQDWKHIAKTMTDMVQACNSAKVAPIFFTDLNLLSDANDLDILGGTAEQEGCKGIIVGAESAGSLGDLLIESHGLSKSISIPVGIISSVDDSKEMETFINAPFQPKLLPAENILNFVLD
jgi:hypothetical protein